MDPPQHNLHRNNNKIEQAVIEILTLADLETATEHSVRSAAADRLGIDLSDLHSKLLVRRILESFLLSSSPNIVNLDTTEQQEQTKEVVVVVNRPQTLVNVADPKRNREFGSSKVICKLSKKRKVSIQQFGEETMVSIRDFFQKDGKMLPSKSGISLTASQWSAFRSSFPDVEAAIVKMTSQTSTECTGKQTEVDNPTQVAALVSQRQFPAEDVQIEADGNQTKAASPTSLSTLTHQRQNTVEGVETEAEMCIPATSFTPQALVPIVPARLDGKNYHCWMHQIDFLLKQLKIAYVLTDPCPSASHSPDASFEETVQAKMKAQKWVDDDYICRHNILNSLSDHLFDKYSSMTYTAKELWEKLKSAYDDDFQTKRSQVNKYIQFQIVDGVSIIEQVQELHKIADSIVSSGIWFDENFHVSTIISKLPPSWKQCRVKLMQEDILPLNKLMYRLRDEEEFRNRRKKAERLKNASVVNSNVDDKLEPRREMKIVCYYCSIEGHKSKNCPRRLDPKEWGDGKESTSIPVSSDVNMVKL